MAQHRRWFFGNVRDEHFRHGLSRDEATRLFRQSVHVVSIECSAFCNRRCSWCSNATIPRSQQRLMGPGLYRGILAQLAEIGFVGKVVWSSGYSEPLAYAGFAERVREARAALPGACLHTHTNGDFLTRRLLADLAKAGLSRLYVMAYDDRDGVAAKAAELCVHVAAERDEPDWYECHGVVGDMTVRFTWRDFEANGINRGGLIVGMETPPVRRVPCFEPFWHFVIESSGRAVPCCHIRTDAPAHAGCYTADLSDNPDIFAAYASGAAVEWRRSCIGFDGHCSPCNRCDWKVQRPFCG